MAKSEPTTEPVQKGLGATKRGSLELIGTLVVGAILTTLVVAHGVTSPAYRKTSHIMEHVWSLGEATGLYKRPTAAAWHAIARQVHTFTRSCFFLSGAVSSDETKPWSAVRSMWDASVPLAQYQRSWGDVYFALTWGMILYMIRTVLTHLVLLPVSRILVKRPDSKLSPAIQQHRFERKVCRFAEQSWIVILYTTSLVMVMSVVVKMPFWPTKLKFLWRDYPHTTMDALTKVVYLWEASNYVHQLFVINLEERRSDFWQMLIHHIVTLFLIGGSFTASFYRVGYAILALMDPADVCLGTAKLLKYMGWQTVCDIMFGVFMVVWTITRHILYAVVWYSCYRDAPAVISFKTSVDLASGHMLTQTTYTVFLVLLGVLQFILLIWFGMIVNVAVHVLTKGKAVDSRSDQDSDSD